MQNCKQQQPRDSGCGFTRISVTVMGVFMSFTTSSLEHACECGPGYGDSMNTSGMRCYRFYAVFLHLNKLYSRIQIQMKSRCMGKRVIYNHSRKWFLKKLKWAGSYRLQPNMSSYSGSAHWYLAISDSVS